MKRIISPCLIVALISGVLGLGCSSSDSSSKTNSQDATIPAQYTPSSDYLNINGAIISIDEQQRLSEKVEAEKKRRSLSDEESLKLLYKETDKLIAEKKAQQKANQ